MSSLIITAEEHQYISERYTGVEELDIVIKQYLELPTFKINENINLVLDDVNSAFDTNIKYSDDIHQVVRYLSQYRMIGVFNSMKIDLDDPNVEEDRSYGNIGTPGRIVKMWCGSNTNDDRELLSGRWANKPRLAKFPNTHKDNFPITKRVDLTAVCSHHAAPFSTTFRPDAYAVISYIPKDWVLGISKLQRLTDWVSQRGWLQEELTQTIYNEISAVAETDSVYVKLYNVTHTCESLRGAKSKDGAFTSEYYGGDYNDRTLREDL